METELKAPAEQDAVIRLVLGVTRLGEASLKGWWQSHGLDQAGRYVLGGAFPRTWRCAALELAVASAKRRHDEALGRPTALHLFSDQLPFRRLATAWLAEQKTRDHAPLIDELMNWTAESAASALKAWAGMEAVGENVGSGLLLGHLTRAELEDADTVVSVAKHLATAYLDQTGDFRAPYFDLAR